MRSLRQTLTAVFTIPLILASTTAPAADGKLLLGSGDYRGAESAFRSQLETAHTPATRGTLASNLGVALFYQGRFAEAESAYRRAISDLEAAGLTRDLASTLNNLAALYRNTGRFSDARLMYGDALHLYDELNGPESVPSGIAWNNIAELDRATGHLPEAERAVEHAAKILSRGTPAQYSQALHTHAAVSLALGKLDEAERLVRHALELRKGMAPLDSRVANSTALLGAVQLAMKQYETAEQSLLSAVQMLTQSLGANHPNVAAAYNNLAQVYKFTGRLGQADGAFRQALSIWEHSLGRENIEYAMGLSNFADLLRMEHKYGAAAKLYRQALSVLRATGNEPRNATLVSLEKSLDEMTRADSIEHASYKVDYHDLRKR